ncbi:hypothetical protein XA68_14633 [Ophiocordyceps unilateralis]|uniref:Uncharacterized protein n=1 Tax=Ophiocordyceps unilateralis TaxID=268505 RepID=A0A2A9P9Z5_OPHUN|nr:hypothetical protein XA68_14633 [Ophiocordyceps unilateralis]
MSSAVPLAGFLVLSAARYIHYASLELGHGLGWGMGGEIPSHTEGVFGNSWVEGEGGSNPAMGGKGCR